MLFMSCDLSLPDPLLISGAASGQLCMPAPNIITLHCWICWIGSGGFAGFTGSLYISDSSWCLGVRIIMRECTRARFIAR
mmetsp:Transcript_22112/g.47153  ORF Transcript_22112/g.47153 Transcript_22112/m.47153 type:complete len:80 (-) Transcript_22112:559-798(-)